MKTSIKERPILFNAEMVRAILDGRKTKTRREIKPQPKGRFVGPEDYFRAVVGRDGELKPSSKSYFGITDEDGEWSINCPYGQVGDRLWVRETFAIDPHAHLTGHRKVLYKTDSIDPDYPIKWRPSIHMLRWASRINLEITGVKVERLNEISEQDAIAEGIEQSKPGIEPIRFKYYKDGKFTLLPRHSFESLWESINGEGSWALNPFVWVISFKRVQS